MKAIVLVGLKHSGKSSVGLSLAWLLKCPFYDADHLLEEYYFLHYRCQKKHTCREIYGRLGKQEFDQLQLQTVEHFFANQKHSGSLQFVLALGGGAADIAEIGNLLHSQNCLIIFLQEQLERLFERIVRRGLPPFLKADSPEQSFAKFQEQSETRLQSYRHWANFSVWCNRNECEEIAQQILLILQEKRYDTDAAQKKA